MKRRIEHIAFVLVAMMLGASLHAQKDPNFYWGPDTTLSPPTDVEDLADVLDHVFGNLESHLTYDVLADRMPEISRRHHFTGQGFDSILTTDDLLLIYSEITEAQFPWRKQLNFFQQDSIARSKYFENDVISIAWMRYKYHRISDRAKENQEVYWDGYEIKLAQTAKPKDVFETHELFAVIPFFEGFLHDGVIKFVLDESFMFTNLDDDPIAIAIDFGDGSGFREVRIGEEIEVFFGQAGEYRIYYTAHFESGDVLEGSARFEARDADPALEYDCGEGTTIHQNTTVRDMPQDLVHLIAPAPIPNTKNLSTTHVNGTLGIYYGCGNTECVIRKPVIMVSGYGPDVMYLAEQKRLEHDEASKMLYQHMNGVYGIDLESLEGANNGANILYKLRNEGYDIIILHFDNGVDYVQNHAALVERTIDYVNEQKQLNGSKYENVIIGQSMGGISTRYALAKWEQDHMQPDSREYKHHHCRLWISWEGEMQGATIPLGIQLNLWYASTRLPVIVLTVLLGMKGLMAGAAAHVIAQQVLLHGLLNNVAAQSMLTYHYVNNKENNDPVLHKHPNHTILFSELAMLGYPEAPRRVAIANGSSTVVRPDLGVTMNSNGTFPSACLMDLWAGNPFKATYVRLKIATEEVGTDTEIFRGRFRINGIPVPGFHKTIVKNYDRTESMNPGATERFYKHAVYPMAKLSFCKKDNYEVPFVPPTSVFDIQDDNSINFGYHSSNRLFYRTFSNHDNANLYGYPHNNTNITNLSEVTPFHSCFASENTEVHLQNPTIELAHFIVSVEIAPDVFMLQNRTLHGTVSDTYKARYDSRLSITAGYNVSQSIQHGNFIIDEFTDVEMYSPKVLLKTGTLFISGSKVLVASSTENPSPCFTFGQVENSKKDRDEGDVFQQQFNSVDEFEASFSIFPNPMTDVLTVEVTELKSDYEFIIYSIQGQVVYSSKITSFRTNINLNEISTGIYIAELRSKYSNPQQVKFIKNEIN